MSNPEETIQEAIWFLRDITHEISLGNDVPDAQQFVKTVAPHLLRSLRVALRMVQSDPESAASSTYGCAWEFGLSQSLTSLIKGEEVFPDPPTEEEVPEE